MCTLRSHNAFCLQAVSRFSCRNWMSTSRKVSVLVYHCLPRMTNNSNRQKASESSSHIQHHFIASQGSGLSFVSCSWEPLRPSWSSEKSNKRSTISHLTDLHKVKSHPAPIASNALSYGKRWERSNQKQSRRQSSDASGIRTSWEHEDFEGSNDRRAHIMMTMKKTICFT